MSHTDRAIAEWSEREDAARAALESAGTGK
jgi:hypothetical protein